MKVKELIEQLRKMPQELEVIYTEARHLGYHCAPIDKVECMNDSGKDIVIIGDFERS